MGTSGFSDIKKLSSNAKPFIFYLECCFPELRFLFFFLAEVEITAADSGVTSLRAPEDLLAFGGFLAYSSRTFLRSFGRMM